MRRCGCGAARRGRVDVAETRPQVGAKRKIERRKWRGAWSRDVVDLLHRRPDLRGMRHSRVAGALDEAIRWSA